MGMDRDMDRIIHLGNEVREQVIRELIEKAEADMQAAREARAEIDAIPNDGPWQEREHEYGDAGQRLAEALSVSRWLKSQIEVEV